MGGSDQSRRRVWAIAREQFGVVSHTQAIACGFTNRQVEGAIARGEARRLHRGVYLFGSTLNFQAQTLAAVLACGAGALTSHYTAAYLHKLLPPPAKFEPVDVTVTSGYVEARPGIRVHRTTRLRSHERRERDGIPVTAPLRTLIDLAGSGSTTELEVAVAEAFARGLVNKGMLERAVDEARGRRGTAGLRVMVGGGMRPSRTRSKPERKLRRLLIAAGIEDFETNARIGPWEVDFYFRTLGLVVEVDAYVTHSSPRAFERDRRKTTALEDLGLTVHRVTDVQLDEGPGRVVEGISRRLDRLSAEIGRIHPLGG